MLRHSVGFGFLMAFLCFGDCFAHSEFEDQGVGDSDVLLISQSQAQKPEVLEPQRLEKGFDWEANVADGALYATAAYGFYHGFINLDLNQLVVGTIAGWLLADLVSGMGHYATDHLFSDTTPFGVGPTWRFSRDLHKHPAQYQGMRSWNINRSMARFITVFHALLFLESYLQRAHQLDFSPYVMTVMNTFLMHWSLIHDFAHGYCRDNPVVKGLQKTGIILRPQTHKTHHRPPYDKDFCLISGKMNGVLNFLADRFLPPLDKENILENTKKED